MWTPRLAHLSPYDGSVQAATLAGKPLIPQRISDPRLLAHALLADVPLIVSATLRSRTMHLAAMLAIYDAQQREIMLVGADGNDLVYSLRTRSVGLRLDQPDLRAHDALQDVAGSTPSTVVVQRNGNGYCLGVAPAVTCRYGYTAGSGWGLLLYDGDWPPWLKALLDILWPAGLALPVAFWARRNAATAGALAVLALSLLVVPRVVGLLGTTPLQLVAVAAGMLGGQALARLLRDEEENGVAASQQPRPA
jgi:hypothetical protein